MGNHLHGQKHHHAGEKDCSHTKAWRTLLETTTVDTLLQAKAKKIATMIEIQADADIRGALSILGASGVLSAPVVDHTSFLGFLHVLDLAAYVADHSPSNAKLVPSISGSIQAQKPGAEAPKPWSVVAEVFSTPVTKVLARSNAKVVRVNKTTSLLEVAEKMQAEKAYRVAVVHERTFQVLDILTQSDVILWLSQHADEPWFCDRGSATLKEMRLSASPDWVKTVPASSLTLDAFSKLRQYHISSLAVLDSDGKFAGVLSASQLRGMGPEDVSDLALNVGAFLEKRKVPPQITASPTTTFKDALITLAKGRLHRLYILDGGVPVGVVSLTDIIHWLSSSLSGHLEKPEH